MNTDFITPALYEALVSELAGREITPGDAANTQRLMAYWAEGAGAAKINWGVAGDFARCETELGKYVGPTVVKGLCANLHHRATGAWPGHAATEGEVVTQLDEAGKVYHFKHGWIPLDHADAPEAMTTGPGAGRRTKYHVDSIKRPVDRGSVVSHKKSKEEGTVIGFDGRTKVNVLKKDGSHATWYSDSTMLSKHHNEPGPHNSGSTAGSSADAISKLETRRAELMRLPSANASRSAVSDQIRDINRQIARLKTASKESADVTDSTLFESRGLMEKASPGSKRRNIQIITPGWGSSGYYSPDVLEKAAADRVVPAGTFMYLNHASESERLDRPERSVEKIGAVTVEDARWDGNRLIAPADLVGPHAELIEALAPYIGVSISGSATDVTEGEAEGRRGRIIEGLAKVDSVDFVTHAGRGGMVLLESARPSLVDAKATAHGVKDAGELREQLSLQLREAISDEDKAVWIRDFDDQTVWFQEEDADQSHTRQATYAIREGVVTINVPATRPDATTEETTEVTMGNIQIDEAEHTRLVGLAGRVDTLEAERDAEKARADQAATALAEATATKARMSPRELFEARDKDLREQVAVLQATDRARNVINEELSNAWLPPSTIARLSSELLEGLPIVNDGLDEGALRSRCVERRDQHELEAAEALEAAGVGKPRGLGAQRGGTPAQDLSEALTDSFTRLGLSETAAKTAVKGR